MKVGDDNISISLPPFLGTSKTQLRPSEQMAYVVAALESCHRVCVWLSTPQLTDSLLYNPSPAPCAPLFLSLLKDFN